MGRFLAAGLAAFGTVSEREPLGEVAVVFERVREGMMMVPVWLEAALG
jgi:hypothetical protein